MFTTNHMVEKNYEFITCQDIKFHNTVIKAGNMRKCGHISEKVERASKCKRKISKLDNNIIATILYTFL